MNWLLRRLLVLGGRRRLSRAGFVLPTVVMVLLVVILLTTAILVRSFDRSKNASNYRVNQAVLNAAAPAIERARLKLDQVFIAPNTRGTASEVTLNDELQPVWDAADSVVKDKYTFADETRLQLAFDFNGTGGIQADDTLDLVEKETTTNAWRFPVDSDNNGLYDSFTLYGILFRSPSRNPGTGEFNRVRNPLEARTPPMDDGSASGFCAAALGTSATLVGGSDWYQSGGNLKKPFFVYVATVPITDRGSLGLSNTEYEDYQGNRGFSALEYQQDRTVIPPANNAVLYEDDLTIASGSPFRLNGRIVTNSNLFAMEFTADAQFYQVSSPASCFYNAENGKVLVGGNTAYGRPTDTTAPNTEALGFDLYNPDATGAGGITTVDYSDDERSATLTAAYEPSKVAYNNQAYEARIAHLVDLAFAAATDPEEVDENEAELVAQGIPADEARRQALGLYFRNRTRRVPFAEVSLADLPEDFTGVALQEAGTNNMRPPDDWIYPFAPGDGTTETGYSEVALLTDGGTINPPATYPENLTEGNQELLGDRILVGNGLPPTWWKDGEFVSGESEQAKQELNGIDWDDVAETRFRYSRSEPVRNLDVTNRDGFWENKATEVPEDPLEGIGGVRIVTGAGVYLPFDDGNIATASKIVWPDTMPVVRDEELQDEVDGVAPSPVPNPTDTTGERPYLKMRATAVYHYRHADGKKPIACVSTFYDPTDRETARNRATDLGTNDLSNDADFDISGILAAGTPDAQAGQIDPSVEVRSDLTRNNSLNGITYAPFSDTTTYTSYATELAYQASLVYPNGRPVNALLKSAVDKGGVGLTLAEQAAVDSTICGLELYNGNLTPSETPTADFALPHGAIQEIAFLDARQIKLVDDGYDPVADFTPDNTATTDVNEQVTQTTGVYDQPVELRQPLEVRATVLDLDLLRASQAGTGAPTEYMIPNSGIIYATRDDALEDRTDVNPKISASDFRLDPTRRPSGIVLVNGTELGREATFRRAEKGLIVASNLPVYVHGEFNPHDHQEFETDLDAAWGNFYNRTNLDTNFACRVGDPRLPAGSCDEGDKWRSASIISDAVTLLSDGFRFGFRNEGNYDVRNNQIDNLSDPNNDATADIDDADTIRVKRREIGFFDNDFAVTGLSSGEFQTEPDRTDLAYRSANTTPINSSYFNNFVTPVQRRGRFPEYVMEICRKLPVTACQPGDWKVGIDDGNGVFDAGEEETASTIIAGANVTTLLSGTTARPPIDPKDWRFPRRIAFKRDSNNRLTTVPPIPFGINNVGTEGQFAELGVNEVPRTALPDGTAIDNALWYRTKDGGDDDYGYNHPLAYLNGTGSYPALDTTTEGLQPLLAPVLQIQVTTETPSGDVDNLNLGDLFTVANVGNVRTTQWMPKANDATTFNMVMATGDTPSRPAYTDGGDTFSEDYNGGLANLPRFLENWRDPANPANFIDTNISGSFIQFKRSIYATAPYWQLPETAAAATAGGPFGYEQRYRSGNGGGRVPSYEAPGRNWGFDVGLLSQSPDLFSREFTVTPTSEPSEFFRETSRDDDWIETLLCGRELTFAAGTADPEAYDSGNPAINDNQRPANSCP